MTNPPLLCALENLQIGNQALRMRKPGSSGPTANNHHQRLVSDVSRRKNSSGLPRLSRRCRSCPAGVLSSGAACHASTHSSQLQAYG